MPNEIINEEVELRINLDEKTKVLLKVPVNMDMEQARGFTDKLDRLLKISEKSFGIFSADKKGSMRGKNKHPFTQNKEEAEKYVKKYYSSNREERTKMAMEFNETSDDLAKSIYYAMKKFDLKKGKGNEKNKNGNSSKFSFKNNREQAIETYGRFLANKEEKEKLIKLYDTTKGSLVQQLKEAKDKFKISKEEILKERDKIWRNEK
jgi:hypothetical protein